MPPGKGYAADTRVPPALVPQGANEAAAVRVGEQERLIEVRSSGWSNTISPTSETFFRGSCHYVHHPIHARTGHPFS